MGKVEEETMGTFLLQGAISLSVKMIIQNAVLVYHVCGIPYISMYSENVLSLM